MQKKYVKIGVLALIIGINGCASYRTTAIHPEPNPLVAGYPSSTEPQQPAPAEGSRIKNDDASGVITLPEALRLALLQNPSLHAFSYEIRAAEARALQASLLPNPELGVEVENFAGSGDVSGFRSTETTLSVSQIFLMGGKRNKAVQAAVLEGDLAAWDYQSRRLDVFTAVRKAFLEVLAAQKKVTLNKDLVKLSEQLLTTISHRVKAGKVSPAEESRARVILSATQVELERARRELESARIRLAATWGSSRPAFESATGVFDTAFVVPDFEKLRQRLPQNPDMARFDTQLKQRQAVIALADAQRIPDPVISGGVRRLNEADNNALVVGLSIPLPISNRNQGARQEARVRLSQTVQEKRAVEIQLIAALTQAYNRLKSVFNEIEVLKTEILPEARRAFKTINEGYLQGRFNFLDVLDAQRTLFEARGQYLNSLMEFHTMEAEIERLVSQEIKTIK